MLQIRLLTMSALELDRLTVIERVGEGRLTQVEASKQLGVTPRHLRRLIRDFDNDGAQALVSKKRGKRSNRAYADAVKNVCCYTVAEPVSARRGAMRVSALIKECHRVRTRFSR